MTNRISTYQPKTSIIVYSNGNQYYIEKSNIIDNKLTGYSPINNSFIEKIVSQMAVNSKYIDFGGYIPANVIGYSKHIAHSELIWKTTSKKINLLFDSSTKIESKKRIVPGLIWHFDGSLYIYAYIDWNELETELFHAPFYNINNGFVCLGSAGTYVSTGKKHSFQYLIETVETAFWNSYFTHAGSDDCINGNFIDLFNKTLSADKYPIEFLKPINKKLDDLITDITKDE